MLKTDNEALQSLQRDKEKAVADALFEKGIDVIVTAERKTWWQRLFKLPVTEKKLIIKPLTAEGLFRVSEKMLDLDGSVISPEVEDGLDLMQLGLKAIRDNHQRIADVLRLTVYNVKRDRLITPRETRFILKNTSHRELLMIVVAITRLMDVSDFLQCLALMTGVNIFRPKTEKSKARKTTSTSGVSSDQ